MSADEDAKCKSYEVVRGRGIVTAKRGGEEGDRGPMKEGLSAFTGYADF